MVINNIDIETIRIFIVGYTIYYILNFIIGIDVSFEANLRGLHRF